MMDFRRRQHHAFKTSMLMGAANLHTNISPSSTYPHCLRSGNRPRKHSNRNSQRIYLYRQSPTWPHLGPGLAVVKKTMVDATRQLQHLCRCLGDQLFDSPQPLRAARHKKFRSPSKHPEQTWQRTRRATTRDADDLGHLIPTFIIVYYYQLGHFGRRMRNSKETSNVPACAGKVAGGQIPTCPGFGFKPRGSTHISLKAATAQCYHTGRQRRWPPELYSHRHYLLGHSGRCMRNFIYNDYGFLGDTPGRGWMAALPETSPSDLFSLPAFQKHKDDPRRRGHVQERRRPPNDK